MCECVLGGFRSPLATGELISIALLALSAASLTGEVIDFPTHRRPISHSTNQPTKPATPSCSNKKLRPLLRSGVGVTLLGQETTGFTGSGRPLSCFVQNSNRFIMSVLHYGEKSLC